MKKTAHQIYFLLFQKEAILTFLVLMWLILGNYLINVVNFRGMDVTQMYYPMKLLVLSYNRVYLNSNITMLIIQLYPLLVVLPAGFSFVKEQHTQENVFLITRIGKKNYLVSRLAAAFFTTMLVIVMPFLIEIVMYVLSFPMKAQNDLTHLSIYHPEYAQMVHNYMGSTIYLQSPLLYTICGVLFFGIISGILGMLTVSISFVVTAKYRILLFLPVFLLLNGSIYLNELITSSKVELRWYEYMLLFHDSQKQAGFFGVIILIMLLWIVCNLVAGMKRENW